MTNVNPKAKVLADRVLAELKASGTMPLDPAAAAALRERVGTIIETGAVKPLAEDAPVVRRLRVIGCGVKVDAVEDLAFGYTPRSRYSFTLTPNGPLFGSESPKRTKHELEVADDIRRVFAAIERRPVLRFVYTGSDGQARTHNVVPVKLFEGSVQGDGTRWLLEGFDIDVGDLRSFDLRAIDFANDSVGVEAIRVERLRQKQTEGWSDDHDDAHGDDELVRAAACYALHDSPASARIGTKDAWPWELSWDKRTKHTKMRRLAIAGALIAAAIDVEARRLERAERTNRGPGGV